MKFNFKYIAAFVAFTTIFTSCNDDDNGTPAAPGTTGDAELFFDNGVAGDALILGNTYTNSNGENITINRLNYIISNVVFIKEDGTEYAYPKEEGYFIISEQNGEKTVHLENIPADDYKKVRFGIGVDQQRYLQGETAQQSFWDLAAGYDLTWTWSTGYKFILFEGAFSSNSIVTPTEFQVHQGSNTSTDNYREVTLDLPTTARVRQGEVSTVHIKTDVNTVLDGMNKIKLSDNLNNAGTAASIMGGEALMKIAQNTTQMFTVDHVHNGEGHH